MDQGLALVLAGSIPAAITTVGAVLLGRWSRGIKAKVEETHHSVTVNGHGSEVPTVLDRLGEVAALATEARDLAAEAATTAATTQAQLSDHLSWSDTEVKNIWRAVWYAFRRSHERTEENELPEQR